MRPNPGCQTVPSNVALVVLLTLVGFLLPHSANAQQEVVSLAPPCETCTIQATRLTTLGEPSGEGMLVVQYNRVVTDSQGRFFVTDDASPKVRVFDGDGTVITALGREGEGPGEFLFISATSIGPADSLFVFDPNLGRISVFTPDLTLGRTVTTSFGANPDATFLEHGWVLNASIRTADRVGQPLHLVGSDGKVLKSFGSRTGAFRPDVPYGMRRVVGPATASAVWSGWLNQYVLERWNVSGDLELAVKREAEWFETYWDIPRSHADRPPPPAMRDVRQDDNVLWVMITVPDAEWREGIGETIEEGRRFTIADRNRYQDTVIEAVDIEGWRVISSQRFDQKFHGFAGPGVVYGPEFDATGNPLVSLWQLQLNR